MNLDIDLQPYMVILIRKRSAKKSKKTLLSKIRETKMFIVLAIVVALVAIIGIYMYISPTTTNTDNNGENDTGEDFTFTLLDGTKKHLSDYRGKVVILDMWATWCTPCQFQMIELKKAYDNYSRDELEILSIDIDTSETSQQIQSFIEEFKNQLDIELDWIFGMDDGSIWEKYMISGGIPTLCIFDQDGKTHFTKEGIAVFSEIPAGWPEDTTTLAPRIDELIK